jgi:hypothetical protein
VGALRLDTASLGRSRNESLSGGRLPPRKYADGPARQRAYRRRYEIRYEIPVPDALRYEIRYEIQPPRYEIRDEIPLERPPDAGRNRFRLVAIQHLRDGQTSTANSTFGLAQETIDPVPASPRTRAAASGMRGQPLGRRADSNRGRRRYAPLK